MRRPGEYSLALKHELAEEIEEAVSAGIAREIAEAEIIDDYLNRHNPLSA